MSKRIEPDRMAAQRGSENARAPIYDWYWVFLWGVACWFLVSCQSVSVQNTIIVWVLLVLLEARRVEAQFA